MNSIIHAINSAAEAYAIWLLHGGWQAALVAVGVLVLLKFAPRIPLSIQYALLLLALVKFITPPLMTMPSGLFSMVNVAPDDLTAVPTAYHNTLNDPKHPAIVPEGESLNHIPSKTDSHQDAATASANLVDSPSNIAINQQPTLSPALVIQPTLSSWSVLLLIHVAISAMFVAWIVIQMARLRSMIAGSTRIQWTGLNVSIPSSLVRGIDLRHNENANGPIAFGILRPAILVPSTLLASDPRTLESVLLHEVAHIRRKDLWVRWFEIIVQAVWWLNPLVWVVARKLSSVREDICDDFAIINGHASEDQYCQTLIDVAAQSPRPVGSLLACGIMDAHPLARRIKRLMNQERLRARPLSIMAMALVLMAAVVLLPGVRSQRLAQAQAPQASPESAEQDRETPSAISQSPSSIDVPSAGLKLKTQLGRSELHRVSVHGVVRNEAGESVSDATVIIGSPRVVEGTDDQGRNYFFKGEIARTTTDKNGRYEFKDLVVPCSEPDKDFPYPEPLNAKLQIVAIAKEYGLTWSSVFRYRPDIEIDSAASKVKPNVAENEDWSHVFFHGQDIDVPVTIVKGVTLHGTLVDEKDSPIPDAVVRLGRVLMPDDGIDSEPRNTRYRFIDSPLKELRDAPCDIIPVEFRQTKTDAQGHYQLLHVPLKVQAAVSFSHPRFPANELFDITTSGDSTAKHDISSGQPLNVVAKTMNQLQLSVIDESGTKLPGSRFEIVSGASNSDSQHSSIATADASGIAKLGLSEGSYSIRISPPSNKKIWSSIFKIDVKADSSNQDKGYSLVPSQAIRIKATSFQDGQGIKDIAFEYCSDANPDASSIWQPVATQGVSTEFVRTDHTGKLDAMFPISVMSIRVAGEKTRAMLRFDRPILIADPAITEVEFIFANRPKPYAELDARYAKISRGRYRYRTHNHLRKAGATLPQMEELVASMRTMDPKEALSKLQNFFGDNRLSDKTLIQDGSRRKVTNNAADDSDVSIHDGMHTMHFDLANRQCDVYFTGDSSRHTPSIGSLLVNPMSEKDKNGKPHFPPSSLVQEGQNFVRRLKGSDYELIDILASDKQFVIERQNINGKTETNTKKRSHVAWQLFPREIDGEMLPTIVIQADFADDILDRVELVVFDEIELLDNVPGDTFAMRVPAGTLLIDHRFKPDNSSSPDIRTLRFATFDVAALLKPISTWSLLDSKSNP